MSFDPPEIPAGTVRRLSVLPGPGRRGDAGAEPFPTSVSASPPGTFRATEAQWAALTVDPVRHAVFRPMEETACRTDGYSAPADSAMTVTSLQESSRAATQVGSKCSPLCEMILARLSSSDHAGL